jgi:predicted nucleic acid-binding protein
MLLDSWAWMELFTQGKGAGRVMEVLDESPTIHTCPVVVAEVYTNVARRADEATARKVTARVLDDAIHATSASAIFLAQRRKSRSFPLSDGFVLAAAKAEGLRVLSGDPHFRGLPEVEFLG